MNFFPSPPNQGPPIRTLPLRQPNGFPPQIPPTQGSLIRTLPLREPNGFPPQIPLNSYPREQGGRKPKKSRKQSRRRRTKSVRHRRYRL